MGAFGDPGCECCGPCSICLVGCDGRAITSATVAVYGPSPATDLIDTWTLDGDNCFTTTLLSTGNTYRFDVTVDGYETQSITRTLGGGSPCATLTARAGQVRFTVDFCCGSGTHCGDAGTQSIDVGGTTITMTNTRTGRAYSCVVPAGANGCTITVNAYDDYVVSVSGWPSTYFAPDDATVTVDCCLGGEHSCHLSRKVERRTFTICANVDICACFNETGIAVGDDGAWTATVTVCGQTVTAVPDTVVYNGSSHVRVRWCATVTKSAPGSCSPYDPAVWSITAPAPWVSASFTGAPLTCRPDLCSAVIYCGYVGTIEVDSNHVCCDGVACLNVTASTPLGSGTAVQHDCLACRWYGYVDFTAAGVITATSCSWDSGSSSWVCTDTIGTATVRVWFYFDIAGNLVVVGGLKRKCGDPGTCGGGDLITPCPTAYRWIAHNAAVTITNALGHVSTVNYFTDPSNCDAPGLYTTACGSCPAAFWETWSAAITRPCPWDGTHPVTATLTRPVLDPDCPELVPSGPEGTWSFTPVCDP